MIPISLKTHDAMAKLAEGAQKGEDNSDLISVANSEIKMNTHNTVNYKKFYDEQVQKFSKAHDKYETESAKNGKDADMQSENSHLLNAPVPRMTKKPAKAPELKKEKSVVEEFNPFEDRSTTTTLKETRNPSIKKGTKLPDANNSSCKDNCNIF